MSLRANRLIGRPGGRLFDRRRYRLGFGAAAVPVSALAAALFLATLPGCFLLPEEEDMLAPPLIEPPAVQYRTVPVTRGDIEQVVQVSASFESESYADLFFAAAGGRIARMNVFVGQAVEAGEVIMELERDDLERAVALRRIDLERAQLAVASAREQNNAEITRRNLELDLQLESLTLDRLSEQLERQSGLAGTGSVSEADVRDLQWQLRRQEVVHERAQMRLVQHLAADTAGAAAIRNAELEVEKIQIDLEYLEQRVEEAVLRAPKAGTVVFVHSRAQEGETIQAYQTLVRIADPTRLRLRYQGNESSNFAIGNAVDVQFENEWFNGSVVQTAATVPFEERDDYRNVVIFSAVGLPESVRIGDYARIRLVQASAQDAILIPRNALYRFGTRRYVQVLIDGIKEERDVEPGIESATAVEIRSGLEEGDLLIVN